MKKRISMLLLGVLGTVIVSAPAQAGPGPAPVKTPVVAYMTTTEGPSRSWEVPKVNSDGQAYTAYCKNWERWRTGYSSLHIPLFRYHMSFHVCYHYVSLYWITVDSWDAGTWASNVVPWYDYDGTVGSDNWGGRGKHMVKAFRQGKFCAVISGHTICAYPWIWQELKGDYNTHGPRYWWNSGRG